MRRQADGLFTLSRIIPGRNGTTVRKVLAIDASPSEIEWLCAKYENCIAELSEFAQTVLDQRQDVLCDAINTIVNRHVAAIAAELDAIEVVPTPDAIH